MELANRHCEPIAKGTPPLGANEAAALAAQVPAWTRQDTAITRDCTFATFREAIAFVNLVAVLAEAEQHHPEICIDYNKVHLTLSTHKIGGLSENDFILAAKIDRL